MTNLHSDALVFFGATGDLAYYVEKAWRIVDPVLKARSPVYEYEPNTWGPREVERVVPPGGWSNPNGSAEIVAVAA